MRPYASGLPRRFAPRNDFVLRYNCKMNSKGFGLIEILLVMGAMMAMAYFAMNNSGPNSAMIKPKEVLEQNGLKVPEQVNMQNASKVGEDISKQMTEDTNKSSAQMKCALEGGEGCP